MHAALGEERGASMLLVYCKEAFLSVPQNKLLTEIRRYPPPAWIVNNISTFS